jgi:hypothetical protein
MLREVCVYGTLDLLIRTNRLRFLRYFFLGRVPPIPWLLRDHLSIVGSSSASSRVRSCFRMSLALVASANSRLSPHTIMTEMGSICLRRVTTDLTTWTIHSVANGIRGAASRCKSRLNLGLGRTVWRWLVWPKTIVQAFPLSGSLLVVTAFWLGRSSCGWLRVARAIRTDIVSARASCALWQTIRSFWLRLALRFANNR